MRRSGIVGPNGAGKTTLFNCLFGLEDPDEGTVVFDGRRIDRLPVWKRCRLGIGRTFQRMELFEGMTVADHLLVAEQAASGTVRIWRDLLHRGGPTPAELHHVEEVLELLGLTDLAGRPVDTLDLGHAAAGGAGTGDDGTPRLLMLDEPSSGLDAEDTARLSRILGETRRVHRGGGRAGRARPGAGRGGRRPAVRPQLRQGAGLGRGGRGAGRPRGPPRLPREHGVTAGRPRLGTRPGRPLLELRATWAPPTGPTRRSSACR